MPVFNSRLLPHDGGPENESRLPSNGAGPISGPNEPVITTKTTTKTTDRVTELILGHGKVNEMDLEFCEDLTRQLLELAADDSCRAVILRSDLRVFSAGVDLVRLVNEPVSYLDQFLPALTTMFTTALEFPKPLVAEINGAAIAGGCVMASACDHRVIAPEAKIGIPELRVGVPLPSEGIEIMRSVANSSDFQQIVLTGATFAGQNAVEAGLADQVAEGDQMSEVCHAVAQQLTYIPATVYALSKQQLRRPVMERIQIGEEKFGEQIRALWYSDEVRTAVKEYVAERLKK